MAAFLYIGGNLVGATLYAAVLLASGARLRQLLRIPASPGIRFAVDLTLGAGLCCIWVLGLGLLDLLSPAPLAILFVLQAAVADWRSIARDDVPMVVAAVAGLPNLVIALGPPHFYDAMVYHLGLPWQALQDGGWAPHPENVFSAFPPLAQLVSTPALAWGGLRVPALLHLFAWMCAAAASGALASRLGAGRKASLLLTAAVMLLPTTPLIPGFPAAEGWFLAALIPALALTVPRFSSRTALAGTMLLAGLATASRVQGLAWAAVILGIWALRLRRIVPMGCALPWFAAGAAPWWVKNLVLLDDAIAPVLWNREGLETLWRDGSAWLKSGMSILDIVVNLPVILAPVAPVLAPTLVLAAIAFAAVRSTRIAFSAAVIGIFMWTATGALPRFFTPTLILLMATALSWRRAAVPRWLGVGVVGGMLAFGATTQVRWMNLVSPAMILPLSVADAAPYVAPYPPFAAFQEADSVLPTNARILVVGDARAFGLKRPFTVTSQHDPCLLRKNMEGGATLDVVVQELAELGITHLLVNTGEMERLSGNYPVAPWRTTRGHGRWMQLLRLLAPPVIDRDGVQVYEVRVIQTFPK